MHNLVVAYLLAVGPLGRLEDRQRALVQRLRLLHSALLVVDDRDVAQAVRDLAVVRAEGRLLSRELALVAADVVLHARLRFHNCFGTCVGKQEEACRRACLPSWPRMGSRVEKRVL
jgi:hypothetical protein